MSVKLSASSICRRFLYSGSDPDGAIREADEESSNFSKCFKNNELWLNVQKTDLKWFIDDSELIRCLKASSQELLMNTMNYSLQKDHGI